MRLASGAALLLKKGQERTAVKERYKYCCNQSGEVCTTVKGSAQNGSHTMRMYYGTEIKRKRSGSFIVLGTSLLRERTFDIRQ